MSKRGIQITPQQMINLVQEVAHGLEHGSLTARKFMDATGVPQYLIHRHFDTWTGLKRAARLPTWRHDWPACPVKVVELADFLPQHKDGRPQFSDKSLSPL